MPSENRSSTVSIRPDAQPYPGEWPPPWNEIDDGIRPVVRALVGAGWKTITSCSGHGKDRPEVSVAIPDGEPSDVAAESLMICLQELGLEGCYVSVRWEVNRSYYGDRHLYVWWWTPEVISDWIESQDESSTESGGPKV